MSTADVSLEGALGQTETAPKKRTRTRKGLPQFPLPENARSFKGVIDVDPEKHSLPPEGKFSDPLYYWQSRSKYATAVREFSDRKIAELESQTPEQRLEARKAEKAAADVQRALKNDAVKQALAQKPEMLLEGLSPEQAAQMISQLNALLAEKGVE